LVRALPDTFRADAEAAAEAVVIDPARWGEHVKERPEMVRRLQDAVVSRVKVRLRYAGRGRTETERLVDPLGLIDKDDIWYLIAGTEKGQRTFRVERITEAELTGVPAVRPDDFDLSEAWSRVVEEMEQQRSLLAATLLMEERFLWVMQDRHGRHVEVVGPVADGRIKLRLTAPTPLMIAQHLAGWGGMIEVLDPPSVQAELARLGKELVARYSATE
jgi:predicted DNA-binding transcriptional regulator YafY